VGLRPHVVWVDGELNLAHLGSDGRGGEFPEQLDVFWGTERANPDGGKYNSAAEREPRMGDEGAVVQRESIFG
jgi:hypothetical protein